ncbi:MAG: DEAD/DEAH box helicase family protein [Lachnospiraceae bacterium]|nr:DEAD/DEAH box helicase family protein [Lachnospiraceae bacterium]
MNYTDIEIKSEYRSLQDDIVKEFYHPLLKCTKFYQRAVGFFSSSALIEVSKGLSYLAKNGGKIQLIASPKLSEEDIEAIEKGIEIREKVIENRIVEALTEPKNRFEEERLNLLVNLIANGILEIKIAVLEKDNHIGMYHEKMGILVDFDDNVVAFTGSMNESTTAFRHNYESIDVFLSWDNSDAKRVFNKQMAFKAMWEDYEPYMHIMDFPEAASKRLFEYRKNTEIDYNIDDIEEMKQDETEVVEIHEYQPKVPDWVHVRPYQQKAIDKWEIQDHVGIFDMATGTGKTYTGLAAIVTLYKKRKAPLAIFIVCPYQHLVTQWVEDILNFGMKPIICHSASPQKKWESRLKDACLALELGIDTHMCAIFTNATYSTERVQKIISNVKSQALLVVDEAHNFGAENLSKFLDEKIKYRLALSATLERYGDEIGTKKLFDYFGEKCIEYSLKEAIENDMLVRYFYHPIVVNFEGNELADYLELSKKIVKAIMIEKNGHMSDYAKKLLIKRARLVASATQKVDALIEEMRNHQDENHMLVYCGATTMKDIDYDEDKSSEEDKKQIDIVMKAMGNHLNMKVAKFTAEENASEREKIKNEFDEGDHLQALIAIRCLDEGVNIPSIRKAFILASSTNPKEYVQRRGRVLRKYKNKQFADIYDFILSPLPIESVDAYDEETIRLSQSLVKRELERMKDFADLAENPSVADDIMFSFINQYNIEMEDEENERIE